jgi:FMN-dependent NADH-azoreductase
MLPDAMFPADIFQGLNMSNILFVTSSLFGENSKSRAIAADFLKVWRDAHPGTRMTTRDTGTIAHLDAGMLAAVSTPAEQRTRDQADAASLADVLIAEIEAADIIVIAAPMYNFSISSSLKAWIDYIARAGRTFCYTGSGPEGLLKDKKVFVVTSRGGFYAEGASRAMDFHEPYLRAILGFLGLEDVIFIHAEGQNISTEAAADGMRQARAAITALVPAARAAA